MYYITTCTQYVYYTTECTIQWIVCAPYYVCTVCMYIYTYTIPLYVYRTIVCTYVHYRQRGCPSDMTIYRGVTLLQHVLQLYLKTSLYDVSIFIKNTIKNVDFIVMNTLGKVSQVAYTILQYVYIHTCMYVNKGSLNRAVFNTRLLKFWLAGVGTIEIHKRWCNV